MLKEKKENLSMPFACFLEHYFVVVPTIFRICLGRVARKYEIVNVLKNAFRNM